jgi:ABC-2 type transport system ATP-binding protein
MNKQTILAVQNLRKEYPGKKPFIAVDDISFDLKEGEILGLLGPNGAGKTTTIQMLLSTLTYTSGSIHYFGKELKKHRSEILSQVAFASTYANLPAQLTVAENLNVYGRLYGLSGRLIRSRSEPLLDRFGILSKRHDLTSHMSAGQLTRLMLVKAFLVQPKILLLDEPTASLDPDVAHDVCHFIAEQRTKEGVSILFTSHKMEEVAEICDRVLFMQKGKIIANDTPQNLATSISKYSVELIVLEKQAKAVEIVQQLGFECHCDNRLIKIMLEESQIAPLLIQLANAQIHYTNIKVIEPTLEDYFLKMVGKI